MNIDITHCRATIDPSSTISDEAWPEFLEKFEGCITQHIKQIFPDADVNFQHAEPAGDGITVSDDPSGDIAFDIAWEIQGLWEAAIG
jgi:hypothetical protein